MPDGHDPYAALRFRDYRLLLSSNVLAALSAEIQFTVVEWEIWQRTRSEAMLGYGGLAQFLPLLLLALPAGQAADRVSRKYLLVTAHIAMALTSVGFILVSQTGAPVWLIFLFLALAGVSRAVGMPSRSSLIPLVVPTDTLGNAVTWSSSGWQIASVAGPALGGVLLVVTDSPSIAYLMTVGGLMTCVILVAIMRPRATTPVAEVRSFGSLLDGLRFVWKTKLLFAAITLDLFAVLLGGISMILPAYADKILHVDQVGFGWLRAAQSLGALAMAMLLAHRPPLRHPGRALLWSVAGFGIATIIFGVSTNYYLSFVMLCLVGAFDNISVIVRGTLMQVLTPDEMRGRVAAVNSVFISSTNQLGAFRSGQIAEYFGLVGSVVAGGLGTLLVVAFAAIYWPHLRRLEPLHTLKKDDAEAKCEKTS